MSYLLAINQHHIPRCHLIYIMKYSLWLQELVLFPNNYKQNPINCELIQCNTLAGCKFSYLNLIYYK